MHRCFISPELKRFLEDHKDTLEHIILQDCGAESDSWASLVENGINWRELFNAMLCMKTLKKIEIFPILGPESFKRSSNQDNGVGKDEDEVQASDEPARSNKKRRVFGKSSPTVTTTNWSNETVVERDGYWYNHKPVQKVKYEAGDDHDSWWALLAMIENQKAS